MMNSRLNCSVITLHFRRFHNLSSIQNQQCHHLFSTHLHPNIRKPSVIVTPTIETQIQAALFCAKKHRYEMRIRDGGHDFEGLSYTADVPFVMLDLVNMRAIDVNVANRTAWVQGGALLGELYYTISQKTDTLYFPAGIWAGVGVSGFLSGGGC
ncbi:putative tetrahydroberberine oxidase [Helianthus annuus]|uniref:Tetrahydroberberine oxidase n=1 Tax=Helianthus annuus TaxID=4232 RepID=A0A9K3IS12_HELAN|nr:putative tetrahydroberberine oxidase [Helianthus annuus]KAJ0573258.1 putative tetrahydroberberine oxidase [Helianthus annuus]KAJ0911548.1 putative tetrahydroberberine oxidase [Helianthus annuus]KAJ0915111.1 putative tetrahydroberberine oxidase [Helianthus annuus]